MIEKISAAVEKHRVEILDAERFLWAHPETGYREVVTSAYLEEKFKTLGYELTKPEGIPGFITTIDTGRPGPEIMILGELDSLICPSHKDADPKTGYVHACGHHVQGATLYGIAAALKEDGVLDGLSGRIRLCAVPAEEMIEIEYRNSLRRDGRIRYLGGKSEFMSRGLFNGVDLAFMVHASRNFAITNGSAGCIAKTVYYKGTSAHAGGAPWNGKNALYAAMQGLSAVNALRETFKERDLIRFHPIITHGGEAVNAIPELVTVETYVRGASFEAITDANKRINRALCGAALSLGVQVEIIDTPGYAPLHNAPALAELVKQAAAEMLPEEIFHVDNSMLSSSTDMGDLSCVMPVVHPYSGGSAGTAHGDDYCIIDPERACIKSAKLQLHLLTLLLENEAKKAKDIIDNFEPMFTQDEYLAYIDSLEASGDRIDYREDGSINVKA